jgi:hypothetical protein
MRYMRGMGRAGWKIVDKMSELRFMGLKDCQDNWLMRYSYAVTRPVVRLAATMT